MVQFKQIINKGVINLSKYKFWLKPIISSFLIGVILSISLSLFAGGGFSAYGYFTVYGIDYMNGASVYTTSTTAGAGAIIMPQKDTTYVPAGYMGAKARLFDSNNNLIVETSWSYNSSSANIHSNYTAHTTCTAGAYYYGYGITAAYNGNGYSNYYTFRTPNIIVQ